MKTGTKVLFFLFFLTRVIFSLPIDTGMKIWIQPNGYSFTARLHGDEFSMRFTTETFQRMDNKQKIFFIPCERLRGIYS
ncbi:MAG: hypothetical protein HYV28_17025 [Ignavibacteriales bacterium]|nr:hypothetical protein [Ignavibacteriales bacterium]